MSAVAARRQFLVSAQKLVREFPNSQNIVQVVADLEAAINTMTDEPMRLLLLSRPEAEQACKTLDIDL